MKRRTFQKIGGVFLFFLFWTSILGLPKVFGKSDSSNGVQALLELSGQSIHGIIPKSVNSLVTVQEIKQFLQNLESAPPDWTQLRHPDMSEQSELLFQFNRQRDEARLAKNAILEQPIAFLWAGILRQYLPEYQGFSLGLGPELIDTSWGIIRFKPIDLPDYLVAIPSQGLREQLLARQKQGEHIEIIVVCIGRLIPDESLIYAFSHDGHKKGMILPVVSIQNMMYILKQS